MMNQHVVSQQPHPSHAMLMIFFFVMPATVSGFGNLLLPILASVPEMVFPKINNVGQQHSHMLLAYVVPCLACTSLCTAVHRLVQACTGYSALRALWLYSLVQRCTACAGTVHTLYSVVQR